MVSGTVDRTVRVWDLGTGNGVGGPFTGHTGGVTAVAVGELDGRPVVVSGSNDSTVRVCDLGTPVTGSAARPSIGTGQRVDEYSKTESRVGHRGPPLLSSPGNTGFQTGSRSLVL